jgi:hypothetical protein
MLDFLNTQHLQGTHYEYNFKSDIALWKEPEIQTGAFAAKIVMRCIKDKGQDEGQVFEMKFYQVSFHTLRAVNVDGYTSR